jgi:hypothetical protein
MARDWREQDHPRNPADGQFVDKAGAGRWASRISDAIGQMRGEPGRSRRQRTAGAANADPAPGEVRAALHGLVRDSDLAALNDDMIREAIEQAKVDVGTNPLRGGMTFDRFVVDQMQQYLSNQHPDEIWPHLAEVTARREAVLEAFNPEAAFRSKYAALLTELVPGISQASIDDAAQDHLKYARAGLQAPITDEDLDWGLASYISLLDGDSIMNVYDALMELQQRTGRSFPNTIDAIDEMGLLDDEEDY